MATGSNMYEHGKAIALQVWQGKVPPMYTIDEAHERAENAYTGDRKDFLTGYANELERLQGVEKEYVDRFVAQYIRTALWSETVYDEEGADDIPDEDKREIYLDCLDFVAAQWENLQKARTLRKSGLVTDLYDAGSAGHDFWLTRNGHGAGFWDRGLGEVGDELSKASEPYGEAHLMVSDDGEVHYHG